MCVHKAKQHDKYDMKCDTNIFRSLFCQLKKNECVVGNQQNVLLVARWRNYYACVCVVYVLRKTKLFDRIEKVGENERMRFCF